MNIQSYDNPAARWRMFPNALDFIFMLVWVFLSQLAVVRTVVALGFGLPDFEAVGSPDAEISLSAELDTARTLMMIYAPSMVLSIAGILIYRRLRGGRGRIVRLSAAGLNPTLLLRSVVWIIATEIVIEPLLMLLPPVPDIVGRGFLALLMTVVVAPLCEEILCRGIVLESLRRKYGVISAWIFSSVFFAVMHGHPTSMVNALIIGSILGYVCIRSRSVFSSILLHALNNALALLFISIGLGDSTFSSLLPDRRIYAVVYIVAALVCVTGLVSIVAGLAVERRNEKASAAEKTESQAQ